MYMYIHIHASTVQHDAIVAHFVVSIFVDNGIWKVIYVWSL